MKKISVMNTGSIIDIVCLQVMEWLRIIARHRAITAVNLYRFFVCFSFYSGESILLQDFLRFYVLRFISLHK